ncbi:hypothetical protein KY290_017132 [Solanum tuberosum]|uniref:Uncharacterized protein n=1 Tax=Solanum tuberosum TaxID=4113 RepID=A0ABQ7VAF1_SOLTU|nr:hypothetical protein KY285_016177 [Solanum tuberosum]KAH0732695.1 hypothetical protein KY289_003883 [Solanum tuberosum]KAH0761059.1 hypothetical protein KY290_017132 [Solanum tuberosum]
MSPETTPRPQTTTEIRPGEHPHRKRARESTKPESFDTNTTSSKQIWPEEFKLWPMSHFL